jgi:hypothetical protein
MTVGPGKPRRTVEASKLTTLFVYCKTQSSMNNDKGDEK